MSYQELESKLESIIPIDKEIKDAMQTYFKPRSIKKNTLIKQSGNVSTELFFLKSGLIRLHDDVDGKDITSQFFFENSFASDYVSFLTQKPSSSSLSTLENCEALVIGFNELNYLYDRFPLISKFGKVMGDQAFIFTVNRSESLLKDDAQTRYLKLIKERPKVIERVPLYMISSYLGLTPEALSRIRKQLVR